MSRREVSIVAVTLGLPVQLFRFSVVGQKFCSAEWWVEVSLVLALRGLHMLCVRVEHCYYGVYLLTALA
jgi:hypothetical protein